jgi:membrane-anchored glycerophosphoryl diester phosphodiesterase (GDPDase)
LLGGIIIIGGFILLIIPGIYIAIRLSLANLSFIDKNEGIKKALRSSWDMIKGGTFWTAVLVMITSVFLYMIGIVLFGIGILVTYPLAMILMAKFYRALTVAHGQHSVVAETTTTVVQPAEIEAPSTI